LQEHESKRNDGEGIYTALLAENNARSNPPLDEAEVKKYIV